MLSDLLGFLLLFWLSAKRGNWLNFRIVLLFIGIALVVETKLRKSFNQVALKRDSLFVFGEQTGDSVLLKLCFATEKALLQNCCIQYLTIH